MENEAEKLSEKHVSNEAQKILSDFQTSILKEFQRVMTNYVAPIALSLNQFVQTHQAEIKNIETGIINFSINVAPKLIELADNLEKMPERTKIAIDKLAENGWYLDKEMPISDLLTIGNELANGKIDDMELFLIAHFQSRLKEIQDYLVQKFPKRKKIIDAAFNAHHRKEYELSVPVFLAQSDGVCQEIIHASLFSKTGKVPQTASFVQAIGNDDFWSIFLRPLSIPIPISASKNERKNDFKQLNRHQVLHGESLDYGTEINSLKSISLLYYVVGILMEDDLKKDVLTEN